MVLDARTTVSKLLCLALLIQIPLSLKVVYFVSDRGGPWFGRLAAAVWVTVGFLVCESFFVNFSCP
jgi:hypothetical protein